MKPEDDKPHGIVPEQSEALMRSPEDGRPVAESGIGETLVQLEAENMELKDRLLRAQAETENVRRRAERDMDNVRQYANTEFARDMVQVADNLERAIASIPAKLREDGGVLTPLIEGIKLTEREMLRSLEKHGIKKFNPIGERFDPNFHEAMFEDPNPSVPKGIVTKIVEPGYSIGSRPLRPAKVGVSSGSVHHNSLMP
jgi:molecular chaperone GrpE